MVADLYGIYVYIYLPVGYYHLNLDVIKENLLAAGFSAVPVFFLVNPRQLCWARFIAMLMCVCVCVCVCVSVNKICKKLFKQSTSFLVGAFPLTQG